MTDTSKQKKIFAFDLDGTLAASKSTMPDELAKELTLLLDNADVCIITGEKFEQIQLQVLAVLGPAADLTRLYLMPVCGTQYYRYDGDWRQVYAENFSAQERDTVIDALDRALDDLGMREPVVYGEVIEDRGSQITLSALGQDIVEVLGEQGVRIKEAWDPDGTKKERLRAHISKLIPAFEVRAGGATSIDVTRPGVNKAYGIYKLMHETGVGRDDIVFFGDRLQIGGNDYPVRETGVESREVVNPDDTYDQLKSILCNQNIKKQIIE